MKTQEELKQAIKAEMEELGYKLIPPFNMEVIDTEGKSLEERKAYYQNISKLALEAELKRAFVDFFDMDEETKKAIDNYETK
jgi:hypothetical protein